MEVILQEQLHLGAILVVERQHQFARVRHRKDSRVLVASQ